MGTKNPGEFKFFRSPSEKIQKAQEKHAKNPEEVYNYIYMNHLQFTDFSNENRRKRMWTAFQLAFHFEFPGQSLCIGEPESTT